MLHGSSWESAHYDLSACHECGFQWQPLCFDCFTPHTNIGNIGGFVPIYQQCHTPYFSPRHLIFYKILYKEMLFSHCLYTKAKIGSYSMTCTVLTFSNMPNIIVMFYTRMILPDPLVYLLVPVGDEGSHLQLLLGKKANTRRRPSFPMW